MKLNVNNLRILFSKRCPRCEEDQDWDVDVSPWNPNDYYEAGFPICQECGADLDIVGAEYNRPERQPGPMTPEETEKAKKLGLFPMFSERETVQEAYDYAVGIAQRCCNNDKVAVMTAIQVLVNTYAIKLAKGELTCE